MARHKEFNQDEVLEKAMDTFWRYGYEATSVQDLVDNMGINRGSLYDTFGDKRSLFQAAIAHYEEKVVKRAIARLEAPDASKDAIRAHFYDALQCALQDQECKGCLVTNAAVELAAHDPQARDRIVACFQRIEQALHSALVQAQAKGEISNQHDPKTLAHFLLGCLQGLRVTAKVSPDREVLEDIVKVALSVLD